MREPRATWEWDALRDFFAWRGQFNPEELLGSYEDEWRAWLQESLTAHARRAAERAALLFGDEWHERLLSWMADIILAEPPASVRTAPPDRGERISQRLTKAVFERDAYRCQQCGGWQDLTVDHIVPRSAGGPTEIENLQTLCRSCNSSKGVAIPERTEP